MFYNLQHKHSRNLMFSFKIKQKKNKTSSKTQYLHYKSLLLFLQIILWRASITTTNQGIIHSTNKQCHHSISRETNYINMRKKTSPLITRDKFIITHKTDKWLISLFNTHTLMHTSFHYRWIQRLLLNHGSTKTPL